MSNKNQFSLAFTAIILDVFLSEKTLLAPGLKTDNVFFFVPPIILTCLGATFFILSITISGSIFLNYPVRQKRWVWLASTISFATLFLLYFHSGWIIESIYLLAISLGFLASLGIDTGDREWLIEISQIMNLLLGASFLAVPQSFNVSFPSITGFPLLLPLGIIFLVSGLASLASTIKFKKFEGKRKFILAFPWLISGLTWLFPFRADSAVMAWAIGLCLILGESVPWKKLIMTEGIKIGRRFFHLITTIDSLLFILFIWISHTISASIQTNNSSLTQLTLPLFIGYNFIILLSLLLFSYILFSINGIYSGLNGEIVKSSGDEEQTAWTRLRHFILEPYSLSYEILYDHQVQLSENEKLVSQQLLLDKKRMAQLNLLHTLNIELENVLDPPVSAQLTANAISSSLAPTLVAVLSYDNETAEMVTLASSGPQASFIPPGYRQSINKGLIGRAVRLRKTQLVSDTRLDGDFIHFENYLPLSELIVPLIHQNDLMGAIVLDHPETHKYDDTDIRTVETVASLLVTSWNRSEHDLRLTKLIEGGVTLSTTLEIEPAIKEITEIARTALDAHFVFIALVDKGGGSTRTAFTGHAPTLQGLLSSNPGGNSIMQTILDTGEGIRIRDLRKRFNNIPLGSSDLRSLLATPLHLRQGSAGAILAFGKQGNRTFSESDEALAKLLATQAAAAIETSWLYQELRSTLDTATQLHKLSIRVIQAEELTSAAAAIAETTFEVTKSKAVGIVLLTPEQEIEAKVEIDSTGIHPGARHPMDLIEDTMRAGQALMVSSPKDTTLACIPLQTPRRQYGALWIEIPESIWDNPRFIDTFNTLANQAAIALERSILLTETRSQAGEIEAAYRELENTYDQTLAALSTALDARDRETEGHSLRVARIAYHLGLRMGLNIKQAKTLERGAILHDIGKIGISDSILLKPEALSSADWKIMRQHPDIGARIIDEIPFLKDAMPVIRYHQERWNGSGYPVGLKGTNIPLLARIFAVVDAFDALTTDRPYREHISTIDAINYLRNQAGIMFDPKVVDIFNEMITEGIVEILIKTN